MATRSDGTAHKRLLDGLIETFKKKGYDGASLNDLADASGLAKASLYHRYPRGKPEIGRAALAEAGRRFTVLVLKPLQTDKPAIVRLTDMLEGVVAFYGNTAPACLMNTLTLGEGLQLYGKDIRNTIIAWERLMAQALAELGCTPEDAKAEAEDISARIQGSLVLARLDETSTRLQEIQGRIQIRLKQLLHA